MEIVNYRFMDSHQKNLSKLQDPQDYYTGLGTEKLPVPTNILLFLRKDKQTLQGLLKNMSHHRFTLIFNIKTKGYIHVDHLSLEFIPGEALLIPPFQFHHYSHLSTTKLQWLFCTFELPSNTWAEPLRNWVIPLGKESLSARNTLINHWIQSKGSKQANVLKNELLQVILLQLLLLLKQENRVFMKRPQIESANNLLKNINQFMEENLTNAVSISDLAENLNLSPSCLRARFKKTTGFPLGHHLRNYRINSAMALLRNSDRSITQISDETGFGSPQAFCRIFKKETSLTPRDYRKLE